MTAVVKHSLETAEWDELAQFDQDNSFFDANAQALVRDFPNQWIAVFHGEVVGHDPSLDGLVSRVAREGFPLGQVAIRQATPELCLFL